MRDFEKLGKFYLGRAYDMDRDSLLEDPVLYDAKDLTTHAVIIGMTGSGKTGLGIGLLEEAAIDRIPVIAIDPKGDLGNILLSFPQLLPEDFEPWVDPRAAADSGRNLSEYAGDQARLWERGLAEWGQDKDRIGRLRDAVDMAIYTPGSEAGVPVSVLKSFNAPPAELREDGDLYRDRIASTATGILALMGIDADPLTSREHILVSNLLKSAWDLGDDLTIPGLIAAIQAPPMKKVGVLDMDSFFPPRDRFTLAMRLNNLLAAPGFDVWLKGEGLDAGRLFHTGSGKPRVCVMSIAHLSEAERMFFVTMLLNEVLSWMRRQPGTGTLRAILYMDEIFGYLPPTANPPSKALFLTLLKQARAYGLGVVLATQNPVDLDYKGLSNTGTWFIGRLQTERDKARVMEGLEGAGAGGEFDRASMERTLAGLGKRRFLLHNVHESGQVIFQTRWVLSYLAGPLTREQIKRLASGYEAPEEDTKRVSAPAKVSPKAQRSAAGDGPPPLPPGIPQFYYPLGRGPAEGQEIVYYPRLLGAADAVYSSSRYKVHAAQRIIVLVEFDDGPVPVEWAESERVDLTTDNLDTAPVAGAVYAELPAAATAARNYAKWEKSFKSWVRTDNPLELLYSRRYKAVSNPEESEGEFRARLQVLAHEQRDVELGKLRKKYDARLAVQERKLLRAQQRLETEQAQSAQGKIDTAVSVGSAILGAFLGRKRISAASTGRIGTAIKRAGRMGQHADDVRHAKEVVADVQLTIDELNGQFERDVERLELSFDAQQEKLETVVVKATSANIQVHIAGLAWLPYAKAGTALRPAWSET